MRRHKLLSTIKCFPIAIRVLSRFTLTDLPITALARRHRPGALQVGSTGIPFATWDRSTVPDKPPHVGVGGHWTSVPAICCLTETDRSTVPSEDVWLSGVFGGKSVSLECIAGQSEKPKADFRHFQGVIWRLTSSRYIRCIAFPAH